MRTKRKSFWKYADGTIPRMGDRVRAISDGAVGLIIDINIHMETICVVLDVDPKHQTTYWQSPLQWQLHQRGK